MRKTVGRRLQTIKGSSGHLVTPCFRLADAQGFLGRLAPFILVILNTICGFTKETSSVPGFDEVYEC